MDESDSGADARTPEDRITRAIYYIAPYLGTSVAFIAFYASLRGAVLELRNEIIPMLSAKVHGRQAMRRVRRGYRKIARLTPKRLERSSRREYRQRKRWVPNQRVEHPRGRGYLKTEGSGKDERSLRQRL